MLGSKTIDELASLIEGIGEKNGPGMIGGDARHAERQFAELPGDFALYFASERARCSDEKTGGVFGVFGLGQQIGGDPARVAFGRQDNRLGWASEQIDRTVTADDLFRSGDVFVARPEYFFHTRNRL